jgi:hypothetical protein
MSKPFDMELFLAGVLTGAHATRERHISQAKAIQVSIADRWHRDNPWTWQRKHLVWFIRHRIERHAESTQYYYILTINLISQSLEKSWNFLTDYNALKANNKNIQSGKQISDTSPARAMQRNKI